MKLRSILILASVLLSTNAFGLTKVGDARPNVVLHDAWERSINLGSYTGKPVLVLYEDKDSATLNLPLKQELSQLAKGDKYKSSIALVAVADVTGYDYWPIRGFVKDAIQDESRKQKTVIYCDWDGHIRNQLRLDKSTSNVVLFGRDGRVLFARSGALGKGERKDLIDLLRAQVGE